MMRLLIAVMLGVILGAAPVFGQPFSAQVQQAISNLTAGITSFVTLGLNASSYINWGTARSSSGYGIRDNGGVIETKSSGGAWSRIGTSATSSVGIGYTTGAGSTVTQATNKTTAVTLSVIVGQITLAAGTINAGAEACFTVTNTTVATTDLLILNHDSGGTAGAYLPYVGAVGAGSFSLCVSNLTAGGLDEQPVISFAVIKGVTS